MEFKKSKEMYVMPIIFMILFVIAGVAIAFSSRKSKIYVTLAFVLVPLILFICTLIYMIMIIRIKNILISVDNTNIYYNDLEIPLSDVDYTSVRKGVLSMYHPDLFIVLKDSTKIKVRYLADPYEASKNINKKYLKLKGNWVR